MIGNISAERASRAVEFGMYRDGDNNLDSIQAAVIDQAKRSSAKDPALEFTVEDTTRRNGFAGEGMLRTEQYTIADGDVSSNVKMTPAHDMSSRSDLAKFVATTLDNAGAANAKQTWIDLIDHGGGDAGGLQSDHGTHHIMREDDMAGAIADGIAMHAKAHPEDAARGVDGVVANQCLMATLGFADALSKVGVKYLAASPETMLAPGVPTSVADDIAKHIDDASAMAKAVVNTTMSTHYNAGPGMRFGPAAAFDVLDLDPKKIGAMEASVSTLNAALTNAAGHATQLAAIKSDAKHVDGMVRFPDGKGMPWQADRPAIALYGTLAADARLDASVRSAAAQAKNDVASLVMAHRESGSFAPFDGADYRDAVGPTVHFPIAPKQVDPWAAGGISETDNNFYKTVGEGDVTRVFA